MEDFYNSSANKSFTSSHQVLDELSEIHNNYLAQCERQRLEIKDMRSKMETCKYSLFSIVIHEGLLGQGHYYCYIRKGATWFKCNDTRVSEEVNEEFILNHAAGDGCSSSNGYLLLYMKDELLDIKQLSARMKNYSMIEPSQLR